jgi:small conductance mechanosensitive channel
VGYNTDASHAQDVLLDVARELAADPEWEASVLEEPEVWGVQELAADSVVVRLVLKTEPLEQWAVAREMRKRIKARFDADGIEIPFPQRTVWMHNTPGS